MKESSVYQAKLFFFLLLSQIPHWKKTEKPKL